MNKTAVTLSTLVDSRDCVIMPLDGAAVPIRDRFTAVENAWAQWRKATEKASFAAAITA